HAQGRREPPLARLAPRVEQISRLGISLEVQEVNDALRVRDGLRLDAAVGRLEDVDGLAARFYRRSAESNRAQCERPAQPTPCRESKHRTLLLIACVSKASSMGWSRGFSRCRPASRLLPPHEVGPRFGDHRMLVDLVQVTTRDDVRLEGVYQAASGPSLVGVDAFCLVHGAGSNFYTSTLLAGLA